MNVSYKITRKYRTIVNGLAFIPTIITLSLVMLALLFLYVQGTELGLKVIQTLNFIQFQEAQTARSLLATLLAGSISLTVFSFSMVMVVVNQSASNYSPKVIEGFINQSTNQIILGIYVGTILFIIISLTQVGEADNYKKVPHFNAFISILLFVLSISLFILFIQNISNSVRINNVVERVYNRTRRALKRSGKHTGSGEIPDISRWYNYKANNSGYLQTLSSDRLIGLLKEKDLVLKIEPFFGTYVLKENLFFSLNKEVDEDLLQEIRSTFILYSGENISENYFYGFRQLREVAVKGLSPGINDPGIAIICLDYLADLLSQYLNHGEQMILKDGDDNPRIIQNRHSFPTLLNLTLSPIHSYGKNDYLVLSQILKGLLNISLFPKSEAYSRELQMHAQSVLETAEESITAKLERNYMNDVVQQLNESPTFTLKKLTPEG